MRSEIERGLSQASQLRPGSGSVELFGFASRDSGGVRAGSGVKYEHSLSKNMEAYVRGELGYFHGDKQGTELVYEALGGLRYRF